MGTVNDWFAAYLAKPGIAIAESVNPVETEDNPERFLAFF
jgi:hypothetical protein